MKREIKIDIFMIVLDIIMFLCIGTNFIFNAIKSNYLWCLVLFIVELSIIYCLIGDIRILAEEKKNENNKS